MSLLLAFIFSAHVLSFVTPLPPTKAVIHRGGEYWGHELSGRRFQTCDGAIMKLDPGDRPSPINVSCRDLGLDEHALKRNPSPKPKR